MSAPQAPPNESPRGSAARRLALKVAAAVGVAVALASAVVFWAARMHHDPQRCAAGFSALGPRCCPAGQHLDRGACAGAPAACPANLQLLNAAAKSTAGCVAGPQRVQLQAGVLHIEPSHWEAPVESVDVRLKSFAIDAHEVTVARWSACARAGRCRELSGAELREPGAPMTGVSSDDAARFCAHAGGRLPRSAEWIWAAAGAEARRFPWGPTGLLCRRASYGLEDGPCANGGARPELSGARPSGETPDGVQDLAGNVAEWTREANGKSVARGGSFRSKLARELSSVAEEEPAGPAAHVGFRCVYDAD